MSQEAGLTAEESAAVELRNRSWKQLEVIPEWVDIDNVKLDRYFTLPNVAEACYSSLLKVIEDDGGGSYKNYTFVDAGVGDGVFYDLLPVGRRLGIDVLPTKLWFWGTDFLGWKPSNDRKHVAVGNPPFGYRSWLALAFLNHAATCCDYIGFILPMGFQSYGKGSPMLRAKAQLLHSEPLPSNSFITPDGKPFNLNCVWQVWKKGDNTLTSSHKTDSLIDVFTIETKNPNRLCGLHKAEQADWFLQRTFYPSHPPMLTKNVEEVKYGCAYGIIIKKDYNQITQLLQSTDWIKYSNLSAHNCRHISMYHIHQTVADSGMGY